MADSHVHRRHTDAFYVLEGELQVGLGPEVQYFTATPGTLAAAPPKVVHTFRNASDATAVFLNLHAPSMGFGDMLRASHYGRSDEVEHFDQFEPPADGGRPLSDAVFRGPGEGDLITIGPCTAVFRAESSDAGGRLFLDRDGSWAGLSRARSAPAPGARRQLLRPRGDALAPAWRRAG
jgi:cupin domain